MALQFPLLLLGGLVLLLLAPHGAGLRALPVRMSAAGFGKPRVYVPHQQLELTRPGEHREVTGRFSRYLAKRCESFEKLKDQNGFTVACDLYARLGGTPTFWFIGKLIHDPGLQLPEALSIEHPVLVEYAKALRPKELGSPAAVKISTDVQLWFAPGNTEMDVAQNKVTLKRVTPLPLEQYSHVLSSPGAEDFVGFQPEIYQGGEEGFRVARNDNGEPLKPAFDVKFDGNIPNA
jgi:hypothetical protein